MRQVILIAEGRKYGDGKDDEYLSQLKSVKRIDYCSQDVSECCDYKDRTECSTRSLWWVRSNRKN